jgi:deoxyribodipyrimidine photolyase
MRADGATRSGEARGRGVNVVVRSPRMFNPILQGEKFDPGGVYVRRWVHELARLPPC